jgi:hypothetical protein
VKAQPLPFTVHVTEPILRTAPAHHFMGFVASLAKGTLVPVQNAPVHVHDVHAVVNLVQQRLISSPVDRSRSHLYLKSGGQKKLGTLPKAVLFLAKLSRSHK